MKRERIAPFIIAQTFAVVIGIGLGTGISKLLEWIF